MSKQAKILTEDQLQTALGHANAMEAAMILLTFRCGMRSCELSGLDWSMIVDASGAIGQRVDIPRSITKSHLGAGQQPLTADAKRALLLYSAQRRHPRRGLVFTSLGDKPMTPDAICARIKRVYQRAGLDGSSHSGRRSFGDTRWPASSIYHPWPAPCGTATSPARSTTMMLPRMTRSRRPSARSATDLKLIRV
jgi:integrase/recombinase XerD